MSQARPIVPVRHSDEMPLSPNSSSTSNARLTPDSDSGSEDSDLDIDHEGESFKLQSRVPDAEKGAMEHEDESEEGDEEEYLARRGRRGSVSTTHSFQLYTPDEERAVVRKFDRKLVLFVALLYMLSFLDRSSMSSPFDEEAH